MTRRVQLRRGRGWVALAVRLPRVLARLAPGPVACMGAGRNRATRERARAEAAELAEAMV